MIERSFDIGRLNEIVNHPEIVNWVRGPLKPPLDLAGLIQNENNILLLGEHGGVMYIFHQPGIYEAHTQVLPEGRGKWTLRMVRETLKYMFTRTMALELFTRVPKNNIPALALTRAIKGQFELGLERGWYYDGKVIPADIYSLKVQDWTRDTDDLEETGKMVYNKFREENGFEYPVCEADHRNMGMLAEMAFSGQAQKGVVLYNRMAQAVRTPTAQLITTRPATVELYDRMIAFRPDRTFWMM